jgi:hypothetical protein
MDPAESTFRTHSGADPTGPVIQPTPVAAIAGAAGRGLGSSAAELRKKGNPGVRFYVAVAGGYFFELSASSETASLCVVYFPRA